MTGNAAIYSQAAPPSPDALARLPLVRSLTHSLAADGSPSSYELELEATRIEVNVMPAPEVQGHLAGFAGYVRHLHQTVPSPTTVMLLQQLQDVRTVLGVSVKPGWDEREQAAGTVWAMAELVAGLVFAADSVFTCAGEPLVGPAAQAEA